MAYLADNGVKHSSIKCYLSAIRHLQISAGLSDPFANASFPRLDYVLKGIKRSQSAKVNTRSRLPITPTILSKIRANWPPLLSSNDSMLWAAFTLGFFGFLRAGEFTVPSDTSFDPHSHLTPLDIAVDNHEAPTLIRVRIKQSKTDPFRQGVHIFLGRTNNQLCPVAAMLSYLTSRGTSPGPLFKFDDGSPLTRARLVDHLREALSRAGIDQSCYSGHSFRIGAATTAAARGVEDSLIKTLGRWESSAYQLYIRTPRAQLAAITRTLSSSQ